MGGLLQRLKWVASARASKRLDRAESAPAMLDYAYNEMLRDFGAVSEGITAVVATKHRMLGQITTMERDIITLGENAQKAMAHDRPDLAQVYVTRKVTLEQRLQGTQAHVSQLTDDQKKLTKGAQQLQERLREMRDLRLDLKARMASAQARQQVGRALAGISSSMGNTHRVIELIRDNIEHREAEAYALDELLGDGTFSDPLSLASHTDKELLALEAESKVREEMEGLKELSPMRRELNEAG